MFSVANLVVRSSDHWRGDQLEKGAGNSVNVGKKPENSTVRSLTVA